MINLPPRFLQPENWQWGSFERAGRGVRFGSVMPAHAKGVIVMLPGLSEFCEKHFETAHWAVENGYGFFILDWYGQGKSGRYLENRHKRHAASFQNYVDDLDVWISQYVRPKTDAPLFMMALSMGGNIGLHYLAQHKDVFQGAAFVCPMFGIKTMRHIPLASHLSRLLDRFAHDAYVPGGGDWKEIMHPPPILSPLTRDEVRNPVHNAWSKADPDLQVGGVTFGWVYEAYQSCLRLQEIDVEHLHVPVLVACAHHEILVDNKSTREICVRLPDVKLMMLKDSYHEPLMERDVIRNEFLGKFQGFLEENLKEAR